VRGLKTLVIVLGVLLVGGTLTLIGAVVWRGTHRAADAPGTPGVAAAPGRAPYAATFSVPQGAEVTAVHGEGGRIVVELRLAAGGSRLVVFDSRSGALVGTIELRPQP
jgi:hypothetical protein